MPNENITEGYRVIASYTTNESGPEHGLMIKREYTDNNETFVMVGGASVSYTQIPQKNTLPL